MSFAETYNSLRKKRLKEEKETLEKTNTEDETFGERYSRLRTSQFLEDIAPIRTATKKDEDAEDRTWFQKGSFDDGYQFGDVTKAILGTAGDVGVGAVKGLASLGEGLGDLAGYGIAGVADALGYDDFASRVRYNASENYIDLAFGGVQDSLDQYSLLGDKSDSVSEGLGQVAGIIATGGVAGMAGLSAAGATAVTTGLMGLSSMGSGMSEAYQGGATDEEAATYGLIKGVVDAGSELIFGGLGKTVKAVGLSKGLSSLDDMFAKKLSSKITNQVAKNFVEYGVKATAEGVEEVLSGIGSAVGKKLTYMDDTELTQLVKDENLLEQFVVGAVTSGIAQSGIVPGMKSGSLMEANKTGTDFITGLNQNEQAVVDQVYNDRVAEAGDISPKEKNKIYDEVLSDMEKGYISTDTIESVLGGDTYKTYKDTMDSEDAITKEFDTLNQMKQGEMTGEQIDRRAELKAQLEEIKNNSNRSQLKTQLGEEVFGLVKDSKLAESYHERGRRSQAFAADVTQYDAKQQATIQNAIDSGILNNTRRTHEFVDMIAKISADKGVLFDFTNNAKLKDSGFAIDGKSVNGYVTKDGVTLNIDSAKSLNSVVGHEITHVLEGTELYTALQNAVTEYAKTKGDYQGRYDSLVKLYEGIEGADVDAELTADLVGDYLFTDADFVKNLSVTHRNVFQKIYDEIKYLCKVAAAGSKEARELEKVKRAFDKAYKEAGKATDETKYSISETTDGRFAAVVDSDILSNIDTTSWDKSKKDAAKKAAKDALTQFSDGIVVDGITRKVNRTSRREYTRSKDTERLYKRSPNVFADKMRAADVADDIVVAATNWSRDGGLKHPRADNFVDFDHGQTLIVSGDAKYSAEVVVGITDTGEAVFYDVVDMTPATFDIKKAEPSTTATTQDAIGDIHEGSSGDSIAPEPPNVKYSISDSDGRQLSEGQQEYFKDSKVRDENGNLLVVYHGTLANDLTQFRKDFIGSRYSADDVGFFFTSSKSIAKDYSTSDFDAGKKGIVIPAYLNLKNPLVFDTRYAKKNGYGNVFKDNDAIGVWDNFQGAILEESDDMGADGILINDGNNYMAVAFEPNQIKRTDNENPTSDPDIRYSLSDNEGNKLSPAVQKRFANSKVVDENGNLKVVYHGTPSGEFSIFDKSKGTVEGDFGSGFYFTDNEADVEANYEGGGPDFENKVARLAEQIWNDNDEDLDYDEAERRARDELYKGSHKFQTYLNIENPAIVGETILLDPDKYRDEYDPDDYDSEEDYEGDVERLISDDIENLIWEVERNVDVDSTDGIADILWEAIYAGGIGVQELKDKINRLYISDSEGNLANNEVTRQIIESLGYDGIIDSTVSSKFRNMGMEEGTTHYIVFKPNQIKNISNQNPTDNPDINLSLSQKGETPKEYGGWRVYGKDATLESAPVEEIAPVQDAVAENTPTAEDINAMFPDDLAPMEDDGQRFESLDDTDIPPEVEAPYSETEDVTVDDPFDDRDWYEMPNRKVKAYMYENPEVKPFFQAEAQNMLGELNDTTKGERWYNDQVYYESGGEYGYGGTKRDTSDSIAEMLDSWGMSYADIEKGLNAIIEDNGAENIAAAKKIEFMLNERLLNGYENFSYGGITPPNQDYINLLNEKQITEYSREAFDRFMESADAYAPPAAQETAEDIAPVKPAKPVRTKAAPANTAPVAETQDGQQVIDGYSKTAKVLVEEPKAPKKKDSLAMKTLSLLADKGLVFENLSLKTGNHELQGKYNFMNSAEARANYLMENGDVGVKSLNTIREEVERTGKTEQFYQYLYHKHNIDRMSLDTPENAAKRAKAMEHLQELNDKQIESIAMQWITKYTTQEEKARIEAAREYVEASATKNKPVFGDTVTAEVSKEAAANLEKANPKFKEYAQDVYDYMNYLRELMVENGVISRETAELWSEMYPHYVPIRRVGKDGNAISVPLDTNKTGVNAPIKRAEGGNSDMLPLFNTIGQRTVQTYKAMAKNSFGVELMHTLDSVVDKQAVGLDEAIDSIDTQDGLLQEGKNGQNPTFTVFEGGKRVTFEITPDMYDALKPTNEYLAKTIKPLNAISNFRRGLLTEYNPVFMLTNAVKDVQDVLVNSQHPLKTYAALPKAAAQMATKGYYYNEYMRSGGGDNSYFDNQANTFKTGFDAETGAFKTENKGLAKLLNLPPFSTISAINNVIERMPRLAEYIASREAGRSVERSMLDAARVTTNFAAGGDVTKFLNRNGATFLNASVQGAMQQVRNVREAKANGARGWVNLVAKFAVAGLPAILLNKLVWDDDEEYDELSDYVKQNYYVIGKTDDGNFIRIPKGRTLAVIQNAIEQISNAATGDDEVDLKNFIDLAISNLAPNNPADNNILSPIIDVATNETWYGEDMVPTRLQDLPAAEQFDESTDSISKWLGEKLNISPIKINYLLDQYSGGVGDVVLPMLTPEAESGDNSLLGNIIAPLKDKFTTDGVMNNQNVADFYDTKDELTVNANASGATDEDILKSKYMNSINAELAELYAEKREIQNSDMADNEKYAAVRAVQEQIVDLTRESLNTYEDVSIDEYYTHDISLGEYAAVGDRYYKRNDEGEWVKLNDDQTAMFLATRDAGDSYYVTDGENHYRWYVPGEDAENQEPSWKKLTDKQVVRQRIVTTWLDITPEEYWSNKEEYDYAYDSPENYAVAKSVGGYEAYKGYASELSDIKADKDANGKSISGSRKEKVLDWINQQDMEYGEKLILFKSEYNADDTYNYEIIDYLNSRDDISYAEMETILKKLGFTVDAEGNIDWD